MNSRTRLALFALAALSSLVPSAAAQAADPAISIAVIDPDTDKRLYAVQDDDKIEITEGQTVLLQLFDPAWDTPTQARRHDVGGKFDVVGDRSAVKLTRPDHKNGTVFLTVHQMPKTNSPIRLTFDPSGDGRGGAVFVDISPAATASKPAVTKPPAAATAQPVQQDQAQALVTALYRGILMREPDPSASSWVEQVRRDGYSSIGVIARELAESRESRIDVYSREKTCNQQRLVAMYKYLLEQDTDGIAEATWQRQLEQLDRGDVAAVVSSLVQTADFQRAHDLDQRVAVN